MNKEQIKKVISNMRGKKQAEAVRGLLDLTIKDLRSEAIRDSEKIEDVIGCRKAIERMNQFKLNFMDKKKERKKPDYS